MSSFAVVAEFAEAVVAVAVVGAKGLPIAIMRDVIYAEHVV